DVAAQAHHHADHRASPGGKVQATADEHNHAHRDDGAGGPEGEHHQVDQPAGHGMGDGLGELRPDEEERQAPQHDGDKAERGRHQGWFAAANRPQDPLDARRPGPETEARARKAPLLYNPGALAVLAGAEYGLYSEASAWGAQFGPSCAGGPRLAASATDRSSGRTRRSRPFSPPPGSPCRR